MTHCVICVIVRDAMTHAPTTSLFVERVRAEMRKQDLSIRALARKMDPENLNRARRNLHRWLDEGIVPGRASREELAVALGLPVDTFAPAKDMDAFAVIGESIADALRTQVRVVLEEQLGVKATVAA